MADDPSKRIRMGSAQAESKVRVGADASTTMAAIADIQRQVQDMATGKANPDDVRRRLIRKYYKGLMRAAHPGASSVRGHKWAKVTCKVGGEVITIDWEYLPGPNGRPMVLAFCPVCYWIAPKGVQTAHATRPVFVEDQLGRVPGSKDADEKFVPFQIQAMSDSEIEMDENDRLTINRLITCPQAKRICGWTVKITDGIASVQQRRIFRPNEKIAKGPLITGSGGK